jgi:DNA-binding transcriptional ArsR family regulator
LSDRSSRPKRSPARLTQDRIEAIERLRRVRMTASEIAEVLGLPLSTVSLWLKRIGLGKRSRLEPPEPPNRYERRHPGELVHVDLKQLGRISPRGAGHRVVGHRKSQYRPHRDGRKHSLTGFEYLHVIVDDHSRLAYAEILETLTAHDAAAFIRRALAWYAARGVCIRAVMTDNGSAYISHLYARTLPGARPPPPPDQAKPATHQRESRTTDPNAPQRMGLRPDLRQLDRTHRSPHPLPRPIQLPTTTRQPRPPTTGHETEQRRW